MRRYRLMFLCGFFLVCGVGLLIFGAQVGSPWWLAWFFILGGIALGVRVILILRG